MFHKLSVWICGLIVGVAMASTASVLAQSSAKTGSSASSVSSAADDAAKKSQILASDRWKQVLAEFDKWLAVQVVYTPQQAEQIKAKLAAQVKAMSAAELGQFLDQWDAKLKVLLGKDASEARQWLGENLQVMADGYRKQFLQKLGLNKDISTMTAAQIEDEIDNMRAQRMAFQDRRAVFNQGRQQGAQIAQQLQADTDAAVQNSDQGGGATFGQFQTQYSPRQYNNYRQPVILPFWW